jgi:hypothetical protein
VWRRPTPAWNLNASCPCAPVDIRRAILAVYLRAAPNVPTLDDVVQRLRDDGVELEGRQRTSAVQRVSDTMRAQVLAEQAARRRRFGRRECPWFAGTDPDDDIE